MKGKGLKIWQAILIVFASVTVVTGGVFLYSYLTTGFGSVEVKPEAITFVTDDSRYNTSTSQFEVDSDFYLTINPTNEGVTETTITLSFKKTASNEIVSNDSFTFEGRTYISNGIISIPQKVQLGTPFKVIIEQKQYTYTSDDGAAIASFVSNVGGLTTIHATSLNILDPNGADITVAVDVPVEKLGLTLVDSTTGKEVEVTDNDTTKVLQNANFEIEVDYYPIYSRYRYSDNLVEEFKGLTEYTERHKDYCFEVTSGSDVKMNYNDGEVFFSSTANLIANNNIQVYAFETGKAQDEFEATAIGLEGQLRYNAMLNFLAQSEDAVVAEKVNCEIVQANVGNMHILNTAFTGTTNKLFRLSAGGSNVRKENLGIAISDSEGADLSSMISQIAIKASYKKGGETEYTALAPTDPTLTIKVPSEVIVGTRYKANPYYYDITDDATDNGDYYYFINPCVKNLKNAYWELSTNEASLEVKIEVVLFVTKDGVTSIFDAQGDLLGANYTRTATLTFTENIEGDIAWEGNAINSANIIYKGESPIPTQIKLSDRISIPAGNTYQKVEYYIVKTASPDASWAGTTTADDVNITNQTKEINGVTYHKLTSDSLLFKKAGTYDVVFITVRTDAYGYVITDAAGNDIAKFSSPMTYVVSETLRAFKDEKIIISDNYLVKTGGQPDFYAIESGSKGAISLEITVAEANTKLFETELDKYKRLKFFAVSADGEYKIELTPNGTPIFSNEVAKLKFNAPSDTFYGAGKAFYILVEYFNTLETISTEVEKDDTNGYGKYVNGKACFMLYTPSPESITNDTLKSQTLDPNEYSIVVNMDGSAQYTNCNVYNKNNELQGNANEGKTWLNERIAETKVYDYYNREYKKPGGGSSFNISVTAGKTSVYVVENAGNKKPELEFASGEEQSEITIYASEDCKFSFILNTKSKGLSEVQLSDFDGKGADGKTYNKETGFGDISQEVDVQSGDSLSIAENIKILVGDSTVLSTKYVYVSDVSDKNLMQMFTFNGKDDYSTITTTEPITSIKLNSNFAQGTSLRLVVSNRDYSAATASEETVRFEIAINFKGVVNSTVKLADSAEVDDDNTKTDGVYAGHEYTLDNLINLTVGGVGLNWSNSSYGAIQYYIDSTGNVNLTGAVGADDIGYVQNGKIFFYDVTEVQNYTVHLYYYTPYDGTNYCPNTYAYHISAEFKVYPNLTIKATTYDTLELVALANGNQNAGNYVSLTRYRGNSTTETAELYVVDASTVKINGSEFEFNWDNSATFGYGEYELPFVLGVKLGGTDVKTPEGELIRYKDLKVVLRKDIYTFYTQLLDGVTSTKVYSGQKVLYVKEGTGYYENHNEILSANKDTHYIKVLSSPTSVYKINNYKWTFYTGTNNFGFGSSYYLMVQVTNDADYEKTIATIQVPLYVSAVGEHYAYYGHEIPDLHTLLYGTSAEYIEARVYGAFDAGFTGYRIYDEVKGEYVIVSSPDEDDYNAGKYYVKNANNLTYPYHTTSSGMETQLTYMFDRGYSNSGIYYDKETAVAVTFENGKTESEYGTIYVEDDELWIRLNNLANEDEFLILNVTLSKGTKKFTYTYRLYVTYNAKTKVNYPLTDDIENGAEFQAVESGEASFNLADVFGTNVPDKSKTRFELSFTSPAISDFDDSKNYYIAVESYSAGKMEYSLGSVYYSDGKTALGTAGNIILESVDTSKVHTINVDGTDKGYYEVVVITSASYFLREITVGGNAKGAGDGVVFDDLSGNGIFNEIVLSGIVYTMEITVENGVSTILLRTNTETIANISFTDAGMLTLTNVNRAYKINFAIEKTYNNVVNGDLIYKLCINDTSGTNYVEYTNKAGTTLSGATPTNVEDTLNSSEIYTIQTKYSTGQGTNPVDLDLTATAVLYDADGVTVDADGKIGTTDSKLYNTVNTDASLKDTSGISLLGSAGSYTLYINLPNRDKDYKLVITFSSDKEIVSQLTLTLKCSLVFTVIEGKTPSVTGGQSFKDEFASLNGTEIDPDTGAVVSRKYYIITHNGTEIDYDDLSFSEIAADNIWIKTGTTGEITDTIEDIKNAKVSINVLYEKEPYTIPLTFDIKGNVTPKSSTSGDKNYAGDKVQEEVSSFATFGKISNGNISNYTLTLSNYTIPATFKQYIKGDITTYGTNVIINTNNVPKDTTITVGLEFTYTFIAGYEFKFNVNYTFTISPNAEFEANYPVPDGVNELEAESVYLNKEYEDFFGSEAPYADNDPDVMTKRVVIKNANGGVEITDYEKATITIKEIYGVYVYARANNIKEETKVSEDKTFDELKDKLYYLNKTWTSAKNSTYDPDKTYYYLFYQGHLNDATPDGNLLSGIDQSLIFAPLRAYTDGYVTFEIEYNKVTEEYKVNVFEKVVDMTVIDTVSDINGTENLYLEQLYDGTILTNNMIATIDMKTLPSGTYYIKICNDPDPNAVNPYHWVGFNYDATNGSSVNVFLGEQVRELDDELLNGERDPIASDPDATPAIVGDEGAILGLYTTKGSALEESLLKNEAYASIKLTSFINISYKTIENGVVKLIPIAGALEEAKTPSYEVDETNGTQDVSGKTPLTFTITELTAVTINQKVEVNVEYTIANTPINLNSIMTFSLDIDIEVQNSYMSESADYTTEVLEYVDASGNIHTYYYLEVEANKEYDFNQIARVVTPSSGDILTNDITNENTVITTEVLSATDVENLDDGNLKEALKSELKDNSDVVRLSFEHVKTNNTASGIVYNFNITPLGADNNGDFVVVKYTYAVKLQVPGPDPAEYKDYTKTAYVLFKILPDYKVTMKDYYGNSVVVTTGEDGSIDNASHVVEVDDVDKIGTLREAKRAQGASLSLQGDIMHSAVGTEKETGKYYYEIGNAESGIKRKSTSGLTVNDMMSQSSQTATIDGVYCFQVGYEYNNAEATFKFGYGKETNGGSGKYTYTAIYVTGGSYNGKSFYIKTENSTANDGIIESNGMYYLPVIAPVYEEIITEVTLSFKYGYGKETEGSSGNDTHTAISVTGGDSDGRTYFINTSEGIKTLENQEGYYIPVYGTTVYENVQLALYGNDNMVKVVSTNAINSTRDVSDNFKATLDGIADDDTLATFSSYYSTWDTTDADIWTLAKKKGDAYLSIPKEIALGQREFRLTLTDDYGYKIEYYFNVVSKTNPHYASGALEYAEGDFFDIGARYDLVEATQFELKYTLTVRTSDDAETTNDIQNGEKVTGEPEEDNSLKDYEKSELGYGCYYYELSEEEFNEKAKPEKPIEAGDIVNGTTSLNKYLIYPVGTKITKILQDAGSLNINLNMPYGYNRKSDGSSGEGKSYVYIKDSAEKGLNPDTKKEDVYPDHVVYIPNSILKLSEVSVAEHSPEEPSINQAGYIDTIEIAGLNAFGYDDVYDIENAASISQDLKNGELRDYLTTGSDLDEVTINSVKYYAYEADGTPVCVGESNVSNVYVSGSEGPKKNHLASTDDYYKYGSTDKIGRTIIRNNFQIPMLDGWVYGDKDYAFVEMRIELKKGSTSYTIPLEIKVTKDKPLLKADINGTATNATDNEDINLKEHIKDSDSKDSQSISNVKWNYYDDTIAVTLPAQGRVKIYVDAKIDRDGDGTKETTISEATSLASNYYEMDSTHYVSMSQVVGTTLGPGTEVQVRFVGYDATKVTREGHFGFYASYRSGEKTYSVDGGTHVSGTINGTRIGLDPSNGEVYKYTHGYGKTKADGEVGDYTTLTKNADGSEITVETALIARDVDNIETEDVKEDEKYGYLRNDTMISNTETNCYSFVEGGGYGKVEANQPNEGSLTLIKSKNSENEYEYYYVATNNIYKKGEDYYVKAGSSLYEKDKSRELDSGCGLNSATGGTLGETFDEYGNRLTDQSDSLIYLNNGELDNNIYQISTTNVDTNSDSVLDETLNAIEPVTVKYVGKIFMIGQGDNNYNFTNWSPITTDKLHIADIGNLTGGRQLVTKTYIARATITLDNNAGAGGAAPAAAAATITKDYLLSKKYYLYPTAFDLETDDVNNRVNAYASGETGESWHYNFKSWATGVYSKYYNSSGGDPARRSLAKIGNNKLYFELGKDDTTSASIDPESGLISVDKKEYGENLTGERYITINIYVKASGETGKYLNDKTVHSGANSYNTPAISIKVYLNATYLMVRAFELTEITDSTFQNNELYGIYDLWGDQEGAWTVTDDNENSELRTHFLNLWAKKHIAGDVDYVNGTNKYLAIKLKADGTPEDGTVIAHYELTADGKKQATEGNGPYGFYTNSNSSFPEKLTQVSDMNINSSSVSVSEIFYSTWVYRCYKPGDINIESKAPYGRGKTEDGQDSEYTWIEVWEGNVAHSGLGNNCRCKEDKENHVSKPMIKIPNWLFDKFAEAWE